MTNPPPGYDESDGAAAAPEDAGLPQQAGLPALDLLVRPVDPSAWDRVVRRARHRRARAVSLTVAAVLLVASVPIALALPSGDRAPSLAHEAAEQYSSVCQVPYDQPAPDESRITTAFRTASGFLISPVPPATAPAVQAQELRRRVQARGMTLEPGTQLRYGLVQRIRARGLTDLQARWILTTCGIPQPADPRIDPRQPLPAAEHVDIGNTQISLLSDSGAITADMGMLDFGGICDSRMNVEAPDLPTRSEFHVGEILVKPAPDGAALPGRAAVLDDLRRDGRLAAGTQVRLGQTQPLHAAGMPRLAWVATTCGLDGDSVRPRLPGVVNEARVYDRRGRLLSEHRSSPESEAAILLQRQAPLPTDIPTYKAAAPNLCGPWNAAYPTFAQGAAAAGYRNMQGCYLHAGNTVVLLSSATNGAAAAVFTPDSPRQYQDVYDARFPYDAFELLEAPDGATDAVILRFLSPTVAEVRLSGPDLPATSYKFDARSRTWQDCAATTGTRAACIG